MIDKEKTTQFIKQQAKKLGFWDCGISKSGFLEEEAPRLEAWLKNNNHGHMNYMENHFDKRLNPNLLVDDAKSVISLTYNYFPNKYKKIKSDFKISKYAYGKDYHYVIKKRLEELLQSLQKLYPGIEGRYFVDSAPVLERAWAKKSGLGWVGKNANLITKKKGSFYFLCELILNVDLTHDRPVKDHCGTCTACIDACPTEAIIEPYVVDSKKCISYLTIELKDSIPKSYKGQMDNWIFGCDVCQDVCPWNKFSKPHTEELFETPQELLNMGNTEWKNLEKNTFRKMFKHTALKRVKYEKLKNNIFQSSSIK